MVAKRVARRNPVRRAKALRRNFLPAGVLLQNAVTAKQRVGQSFYDLGESLRDIRDSRAYLQYPNCPTFEAFLHNYKLAGRSTAYKLIAIVNKYPRETALKMGSEAAYG